MDFNGDKKSDILWQNANGQPSIWFMNGISASGGGPVTPLGSTTVQNPGNDWKIAGTGDFNHDGHDDIVWQNVVDGHLTIWFMNGTSVIGGGNLNPMDVVAYVLNSGGPYWKVVGVADFNGDGYPDILLRADDGGATMIYYMQGTILLTVGNIANAPDRTWKAVGVGDFDGDGFPDILWQNDNGQPEISFMKNNVVKSTSALYNPGSTTALNPGPSLKVVGVADYNRDGKADILWQNINGQPSIWYMNGATFAGGGNVTAASSTTALNPGATYRIVGTGDYDGDGNPDILFESSSGQPAVWLMHGTTLTSASTTSTLATTDPSWKIEPSSYGFTSIIPSTNGGVSDHICLVVEGRVECAGSNTFGELGNGSTTATPVVPAVNVVGLSGVQKIAVGPFNTCAIANDLLYCWGHNNNGQLGNGTLTDSSVPVLVPGLSGVTDVAMGGGWGNSPGDSNFYDDSFVCAIASGQVYCWGKNSAAGQLGTGSDVSVSVPTKVAGISGATQIGSGYLHTCALVAGSVYCWGTNTEGETGKPFSETDSSSMSQATPYLVPGLGGVTQLAVGGATNCVLTVSQTVYCWGQGTSHQLGPSIATNTSTPVLLSLPQFTGQIVVKLEASDMNTCALMANQSSVCWGENGVAAPGQLSTSLMSFGIGGEDARMAITWDGKIQTIGTNNTWLILLGETYRAMTDITNWFH